MTPPPKASEIRESGSALVYVLAMSVAGMVLAVTVYSINVSQVSASQRQIDRIKADQLILGQHWRNYMSLINGNGNLVGTPLSQSLSESHNGINTIPKTFTATVSSSGPGPIPLDKTTQYTVTVNY